MDFFTHFSNKLIVLSFTAVFLIAGCSNPASDDDDHEEHSEPDRIEFTIEEKDAASYTYSTDTTEGQFEVSEGEQTKVITAEFFDEDGDEIHGEDLDDEYSLDWEIANTDIADIEQDDSDGRWEFQILGKTAEGTTVQFMLMHGDHPDFETPTTDASNAIEIHVSDSNQ